MSAAAYRRPFPAFPDRAGHERRWQALAAEIAARRDAVTEEPPARPDKPGELVVVGSGIEAVGFTSADEMLIREADEVFFCVADPATSVWLKALRPDAYDLYVLYDDSKLRYLTYMQMSEAMLHPVRQGKKVVGIFYGHPGIFVLSTHRAIAIARREGHRATMRAAVSALDTLCADLGVDPSHPGMLTFEATDMLIRRRRPDPGLHVVLWQVGLIGELGYRRSGYLNNGAAVLLDYLESFYGPDQPVVNYIGSRYPGIAPVTDVHTIKALREPDVQATVTGISTFYLPPAQVSPVDEEMLERLGLLQPGQHAATPAGPLREIDRYGPREMQAFDDFARFRVPRGYHWQDDTAAARFVLALREDAALRDLYARDPAAAVRSWDTPDLGARERRLLARGEAGAVQVAAKGLRVKADPAAERLLREALTGRSVARGMLRAARCAPAGARRAAVAAWARERGHDVDVSTLADDVEILLRGALYPWSGWYLDRAAQTSVVVVASPGMDRVYVNGSLVRPASYERGVLRWRDAGGLNGHLHTDLRPGGTRRLVGAIWPAGEEVAPAHRVTATEHRLTGAPAPAACAGRYRAMAAGRAVEVVVTPAAGAALSVTVDGVPAGGIVEPTATGFQVGGLAVAFADRIPEAGVPAYLHGTYLTRQAGRRGEFTVGARTPASSTVVPYGDGQVTLLLDPVTLTPMLFGRAGGAGVVGAVPVVDAAAYGEPRLGLPAWAWKHVVRIAAGASRDGGLFVWHTAEKADLTLRAVRAALRLVAE